jgi:hypothetical protein
MVAYRSRRVAPLPGCLDVSPTAPKAIRRALRAVFAAPSAVGLGLRDPDFTGPARGLAALEEIVGQFYMAVLVARFVGLYIVHSQR